MDKRIGAGGIFAVIIGIITLGGLVSVGLLRKAFGTILIMLVGIYAVSNVKGDFFDMIKDYNARSEASEIRKLEFERERMRFEVETELKARELEIKRVETERLAKERERIRAQQEQDRQEKQAELDRIRTEQQAAIASKAEAEDKVTKIKQGLVSEGFKVYEKTNFREAYFKMQPPKWINDHKIIAFETVLSRNELTTSSTGMKWHSERTSFEVNCATISIRTFNAVTYNGPWTTGDVIRAFSNTGWTDIGPDWRKVFIDKFCQA
jgi:hypothetical protein